MVVRVVAINPELPEY